MPDGSDTPWSFTDRGLIIAPGLSYEECAGLWETACAVHRQSLFSLGDAANYATDTLGETAHQFIGDYAPETVRVAMWVCRRIEYARRRPALSFSLHRECAAMDASDQDALLAEAEQNRWRTADMKEAVKARKVVANGSCYPGNGAPGHDKRQIDDDGSGGSGAPGAPDLDDTVAECEARFSSPSNEGGKNVVAGDVAELRACIAETRVLSHSIAAGKADSWRLTETAARIGDACGIKQNMSGLLDQDIAALSLIPPGWHMHIDGAPGSHFTVELRKAECIAVGDGPVLTAAIVEASLAARISDTS